MESPIFTFPTLFQNRTKFIGNSKRTISYKSNLPLQTIGGFSQNTSRLSFQYKLFF
jgi:hypothetical protein